MAAPKTDTAGQVVQPRMITHVGDGATPLTNRDITQDLRALVDDTIKGLMRSLGDAGASPSNSAGSTMLYRLSWVDTWLSYIRSALYPGRDLVQDTATPLAASATYTSPVTSRPGQCVLGYFLVSLITDQGGTLYLEQSWDNTNWDISESVAIAGGTAVTARRQMYMKYLRYRIVNGGTAQTYLRSGFAFSIT